jgi:TonB family protein
MWRSRQAGHIAAAAVLCFAAAGVLNAADMPDAPAADSNAERTPQITMMPDYPKVARRDRIEGEVQVCFDITRAGRTRRIAVRKSTHRIFEKPAIRAVRASTYEPLSDDAVMSGIKSCRTFRFTLKPVVVEAGN